MRLESKLLFREKEHRECCCIATRMCSTAHIRSLLQVLVPEVSIDLLTDPSDRYFARVKVQPPGPGLRPDPVFPNPNVGPGRALDRKSNALVHHRAHPRAPAPSWRPRTLIAIAIRATPWQRPNGSLLRDRFILACHISVNLRMRTFSGSRD
jgi:hypothetical protein